MYADIHVYDIFVWYNISNKCKPGNNTMHAVTITEPTDLNAVPKL